MVCGCGKGWEKGDCQGGGGEGAAGGPKPLFLFAVYLLLTPNFAKFLKQQKNWKQRIVILHRIKRRRLLPTINEMMAAHKYGVIANIRINTQPIVVATPVGLIIFNTLMKKGAEVRPCT